MRCASCDFENPQIARFCGGCGKPINAVSAAAPAAERRHICVLFCDLVGSTPLSRQVDPEDLRIIVGSYQRVCEGVVRRNGGFVAQYRGDSLEVYFGYPTAHEDDASRAVRCGLEVVAAVRQLAAETKVDLQVRIGIHDGQVVVGAVEGPNRAERWAIGDTPNIAARIQAESSPGEVLLSDSLQRLLPATFALESIGFRRLKGVNRPFELFRAVAAHREVTEAAPARTPFLGRDDETARIRQIWARAQAGTPQFILLRGEPGIGKSRLVEVIRDQIADERTDVLVARCAPVATDTAFGPIVELMGKRLGLKDLPRQEQARHLAERTAELGLDPAEAVPLLGSILSLELDPALWAAPPLSPARARQRTIDLLVDAMHALARGGQALLIFEDLHWGDPSSQELLQQLIASSRSSVLTALLTARPEFAPAWADAVNVERIELEGLGAEQAEQLIRKVANDKPLPPSLVWEIRERGTGNPLFLEEITRAVIESGTLVERENWWEIVGAIQPAVVPTSIDASLMARIDRLGEARPLFQLAATIGREFSLELLTAVAEVTEPVVCQQLETILQSGLLLQHRYTSPVYSFKHALIQDAAYASLLRTTRQRYHGRIAKVLLDGFQDAALNRPELLAHHLSGAGSLSEAAAHWLAAGERAVQRSAVKEAVAHFRRALVDLEQLPEDAARMERELSVLTAMAPALTAVFGWAAPQVGETCERAIKLARRIGATDRIYHPLWGLWTNQFVGGRLGDALQTAKTVLQMAVSAGDSLLQVHARNNLTYTRYYRGEYDEVLAETEIGMRSCPAEMDIRIMQIFQASTMCNVLISKAGALWMMGRQDEGVSVAGDLVAYSRSLRHRHALATGLGTVMFFYLYDRDWQRLLAIGDEVYHLSRAEGFAMWTANAGLHRGRARIGLGDLDAGVAEVLEWGALFRQTGSGVIEGSISSMMSEALHLAGRSEEGLVVSAQGERRANQGCVCVMVPEIYRTRGDILRDLDRIDEAENAYRAAVACARAQGARSLELRALTSLLQMQLACGLSAHASVELRNAMQAMPCRPDRADMAVAGALLERSDHRLAV